jgi:hypothetical protein
LNWRLALIGAIRVIVTTAGGPDVRSEMVVDPDGPHPRSDAVTSSPLRRVRARLSVRRTTEEVRNCERAAPS